MLNAIHLSDYTRSVISCLAYSKQLIESIDGSLFAFVRHHEIGCKRELRGG